MANMLRARSLARLVTSSGARLMSTKANVITPKDEFSGKAEMELMHQSRKPAEEKLAQNFDPVGFVDAPWTPKSFVGKTPAELIAEVPPIPVDGARIGCDGGGAPATGHPLVYFNLDGKEPKACNYCGLRYYNAKHH